jgi:glutaredoxin
MDVKIYTTVGCVACQQAKAFLAQRDVEFEECDLSRDTEAMNELIRLGCRALPVIRIGEQIVQGFDPQQLTRALGLNADERQTESARS